MYEYTPDTRISEFIETTLQAGDKIPIVRRENGAYVNYIVDLSAAPPGLNTLPFNPQFKTFKLDLELKKGESAQFSVAVTDYDLDLRGGLLFTEMRRNTPGYLEITGFTGTSNLSNSTIIIKEVPGVLDDQASLLSQLPVREKDLITLEGSGITNSKALAVSEKYIVTSNTATQSIVGGRLFVRSQSLASFNATPYLPNITVNLTASASVGATSINVANITRTIPSGTTLVFKDGVTGKLATLTANLTPSSTIASVSALPVAIASGSTAIVGASTVIVAANATAEATSVAVSALSVPMPSGTLLNFATRTADGWKYAGSATLTDAMLANATAIPVAALSAAIPAGAIAWFGTQPFNTFILAVDPADTQFLESGDYGYDMICRQSDGYTIRLIQGNITLTDHWSDGV